MKTLTVVVLALCGMACAGCQSPRDSGTTRTGGTTVEAMRKDIEELIQRGEKDVDTIEVQHLLVAHGGAGIGGVTRSKEEAEKLAAELYARIKDGADFDALVKEHTDDSHPGIYGMTTTGNADPNKGVYPRTGMVAAFGDVGWKLDVGEVGVAPFDASSSPYGWHIIKRTK